MPMSQAAMDGIGANGHHWKYKIRVKSHTEIIGNIDDGGDATIATLKTAVDALVVIFRAFIALHAGTDMAERLDSETDDLEMASPCDTDDLFEELENVRYCMEALYDTCDYYRILAH